jgi:pimeloyl-ACP methyl ester carboxylesterase
VLDAVLAARQLDDIDLADQTVVWGHSQGGRAALWTGQIAPDYAPDTNVLGVAALAPASDVAGPISNLGEVQGGSIFASYALVGYSSFYDDVAFDDYVRPTARTVIRETAARCLNAEILPSRWRRSPPACPPSHETRPAGRSRSGSPRTCRPGPMTCRCSSDKARPIRSSYRTSKQPSSQTSAKPATTSITAPTPAVTTFPSSNSTPPLVPELIDWTQQRFDERPFTGNCRP